MRRQYHAAARSLSFGTAIYIPALSAPTLLLAALLIGVLLLAALPIGVLLLAALLIGVLLLAALLTGVLLILADETAAEDGIEELRIEDAWDGRLLVGTPVLDTVEAEYQLFKTELLL